MSKIRLYGATSGYLELKAPAVSPDAEVEIPGLAIATESYVTSALSAVTSLRYESGTRSWIVNGSGTEVYTVTFATPFPSAPMIWENHDNEVYDVTFTSVSGTGFTINAPWYSGVPTGAFVRWYALGPA